MTMMMMFTVLFFTICAATVVTAESIKAVDPMVEWSGRATKNTDSSSVSFDWLGVTARVSVNGAKYVYLNISSDQRVVARGTRMKVYISDQRFPLYPQTQFWVQSAATAPQQQLLFLSSSGKSTTITIENIVGPQYGTGTTTAYSFETDGTFVANPPKVSLPTSEPVTTPRNIEIIGDSITAATNVVRPEFAPTCGDGGYQSDWSQSYSGLLCHRFGATCSTVAVGGKCVMHECGGLQMPDYFTGAFYTDGAHPTYDFKNSGFKPDAMVIDLGTNDMHAIARIGVNMTSGLGPGMDQFTKETVQFMKNATILYGKPDIKFFLTAGPMENITITGTQAAVTEGIAQGLNVTFIDMRTACVDARIHGIGNSDKCDGCASHPGVQGHRGMYEAAWPVISKVMGWD